MFHCRNFSFIINHSARSNVYINQLATTIHRNLVTPKVRKRNRNYVNLPASAPFPNENRSAPWCDGRGELIKRVYLNGPIFLRKSDSLEFPIHSNEHVIHSSESVHPKYQNHPTESVHAKRFSLVCSVWIHSSEFHSMRFM